jgi:hypothetical protein
MMTYLKGNSISFDTEDAELIKSIFSVRDLENSDIAIMRATEFFDLEEFRFKLVVEVNDAADKLVGIKLEKFSQIAMAGTGMFRILSLFWTFDKSFWSKLTRFFIGSTFSQPSRDTDIAICRNVKGECIPCLVHLFASYDPDSGVRTAVSWCARPLSPSFNPMMRRLLIQKAESNQASPSTFQQRLEDQPSENNVLEYEGD